MSDQKPTTELTDSSPAPSNPLFKYVLGYPRIAERMARKTETASFRRFSALQARTLLHMQCDLCRLEEELLEQEALDAASDVGNKKKYATDYAWLRLASLDEGEGESSRQLELLCEIKRKFREYSTFIA
jgi:hypothetical protein